MVASELSSFSCCGKGKHEQVRVRGPQVSGGLRAPGTPSGRLTFLYKAYLAEGLVFGFEPQLEERS